MQMITFTTLILCIGSTQAFMATTSSRSSYSQLKAVPPPYQGGLSSATSNLKPGRSYAPTQPGVKHTGSREVGYLANLQRANQPESYNTPSYATGVTPVPSASTQSAYQSVGHAPAAYPMVPTEVPRIVTALLTADGVGGRQSSSILMKAASLSSPPVSVTNERTYITSGGVANMPTNARVVLKGDGEAARSEQGAVLTMNEANIDRVPVVATTAPMNVRSSMVSGYDSQLVRSATGSGFTSQSVRSRSRSSNFAPTQSDVKFKSSSTGSGYLDGLNQVSHGNSPIVSRMSDPFAQPKMAAQAVSGLLHADPRSGESFSRDPFAISRKAADAVSLLLLKYTEPKDALFYLT